MRPIINKFLILLFAAVLSAVIVPATAAAQRDDRLENAARAARAAGVPAEDVELIITRSLQREVDSRTTERFLDAVTRAGKQGLPVRAVVDRIEQGLSKNVSPVRIAAAADRLAEKLEQARPLVNAAIESGIRPKGPAVRAEAIEAVARGLEAALSGGDVEQLGKAVRERKGTLALFTRAVETTIQLAGSGVPPSRAARLVGSTVSAGGSERDLSAVEKRFADSLRQGKGPEDVAASIERDADRRENRKDSDRQDRRSDRSRDSGAGAGGRRR